MRVQRKRRDALVFSSPVQSCVVRHTPTKHSHNEAIVMDEPEAVGMNEERVERRETDKVGKDGGGK